MAFNVPRRIEAKTYEVGDLISLSGLAGKESFNYPYVVVKQKTNVLPPQNGTYSYPMGDIVYPAWSEEVQYDWQDYSKSEFQRQLNPSWVGQWKVWHNGILYEATKWTVPNAGTPPNDQYTNVGDKAGRQLNLKGEILGYATILTNQSHRFRSWKIADNQPNNPYWVDSESMAYYIFNNDYGDDSPWAGSTYSSRSDEPPNAHDMDELSFNTLPNRSWYFSNPIGYNFEDGIPTEYTFGNPLLGGWYVKLGSPEADPPTSNTITSHESDSEGRQFAGFGSNGWNPHTGKMSDYDVYCPHQYDEGNVLNKRSLNLWSQSYVNTRRLEQEPEAWDISNSYPNQSKIFITAVSMFNFNSGYQGEQGYGSPPRKDEEGFISRGNNINFSALGGLGLVRYTAGTYNYPQENNFVNFSVKIDYFYQGWHPMFWLAPIRILVPNGTYGESYFWLTGSPPNQISNNRSKSVNSGERWVTLKTPTVDIITYDSDSYDDPPYHFLDPVDGFYYKNAKYSIGSSIFQRRETSSGSNPSSFFEINPDSIYAVNWLLE